MVLLRRWVVVVARVLGVGARGLGGEKVGGGGLGTPLVQSSS
jgi:hypothetical protein